MRDVTDSSDESDGSYNSYDEDDQLRAALASGELKPGLNMILPPGKKEPVNDVVNLKASLERYVLKAPWVERLDLVNDLAPMAPELVLQMEKHQQKRENLFKGNKTIPYVEPAADPVLNDFQRELLFHRQAQAAVIIGIKRLHEVGIPTKRPDDYFAEMAKTDDHMQRIRRVLLAKQEGMAKSERARQLREQRRIGKAIQQQTTQERGEERRRMLGDIKKFRKGKLSNLDFLDDEGEQSGRRPRKGGAGKQSTVSGKRKGKDAKFGFGGRKKGSKRNTRESSMGEWAGKKYTSGGGGGGKGKNPRFGGGGGGSAGKGKKGTLRPGKSRRNSMKARK